MEKRGNWSQFHFSEVTSYKIHTLGNQIDSTFDFTLALEYFLFKFIYAHCGICTVQDQNCLHFLYHFSC